jgi:hypothetical protein
MSRTKDFYLLLLSYALVEIRFLQVEGDPSLASSLADIFHNVPEALRLPWTEEREERIHAQIQAKAQAHGRADLLDRWEARALRRLEQEGEQVGVANGAPVLPETGD